MLDFDLIPAIDLKGGKCVRLRQGDAAQATEYSDDPVAVAVEWEQQGATRLHLVDLDGAFSGSTVHREIARAIFRALKIPVQFGGGIRTLDQVDRILALGAARVIVGTVAVEQPDVVEAAVRQYGSAIMVGVDARGSTAALRGWVAQSRVSVLDLTRTMKGIGVERIVYTDICRDGLLGGVNVDATEKLARKTGIRVIASGGVSGIQDVRDLWERRAAGIEGVILGRALYDKTVNFRELAASVAQWGK